MDRIVLAYSGGPSSSLAISWLREQQHAEIVTVTVDVGQHESLDGIRVRALASGAVRAHVLDRRDLFARHHLLPAIQAGAMDIDSPGALSALGFPLIAHALVEIARIEGTRTVAHAAAAPADCERIDAAITAIDAKIDVIDVAARWSFDSAGMAEYARERGIPFPVNNAPAPSRPVAQAAPAMVAVDFRAGIPVKINGVEMDLVELLTCLDTIAMSQGTTGGAVLGVAYRALQQRVKSPAITGAERVSVFNGVCEVVTHVS